MKLFLTDVDNCILDWSTGFISYVAKVRPDVVIDSASYKLGIDFDVLQELVESFNSSEEFANLEPYGKSEVYLPKIAEEFGYSFVAISTCIGKSPETAHLRISGIQKVFGNLFNEYVCLPLSSSKLTALESFNPTYWIDDKLEHSIAGAKAGHTSFNMVQPYNINEQKPANIIPVDSWADVYNFIKINDFS